MDLGADGFQTLRYVVAPQLGSALLAGGLLAFALSFDEVIVTTLTAGQQTTLPIWMLQELIRPRQRPVTNVVAVIVIALTFLPILGAYLLTRRRTDPPNKTSPTPNPHPDPSPASGRGSEGASSITCSATAAQLRRKRDNNSLR